MREAAQAYVMLSRVETLSQLFILVSVPVEKIHSSPQALAELERMRSISLNKKKVKPFLVSCNIRSLQKHFDVLASSPRLHDADVICLQETWQIKEGEHMREFEIKDMKKHTNIAGRGKGIVTFCKNNFILEKNIKNPYHQITRMKSSSIL